LTPYIVTFSTALAASLFSGLVLGQANPTNDPNRESERWVEELERSFELGMERFTSQDKNGDGKLSRDEATIGAFSQLVVRFDANRDGFLDKDEFTKSVMRGQIRFGTGPRDRGRSGLDAARIVKQLFSANDSNGDGKITPEEARPLVKSRFAEFDQNGDGSANRSEFEAVATRIIRTQAPGTPGPTNKAQIAELAKRYWPLRPRKPWKGGGAELSAEDLPGEGIWRDPALSQVATRTFPVTVWFDRQFLGDGKAYARRCREFAGQPRTALRSKVVETLKALNHQSLQAAEGKLRRLVDEDRIHLIEWHWIVNGFSCLSTKEGLAGLETVPGVKKIFLARGRLPALASNERPSSFFEPREKGSFDPDRFKHPWYVRYLQADKAWKRLGVNGDGTLNVVLDGSFIFTPNVTTNVYRNTKEVPGNGRDDDGNGLVDDYHGFNFARHDELLTVLPVGSSRAIGSMHGFLCAAIICGTGSDNAPFGFGLAPEAFWAGVVAGARIEPAVEWAIEQGADTLSMSFSRPGLNEYRSHWRKVMEHASFCGVYGVSGAGNFARKGSRSFAPVPQQMRTPEDIPGAVFAPAGVQRNLDRTEFSSQGPVEWETEHYRDGLVQKPDFCAFNMDLPILIPDGTVRQNGLSGNSFAGPMLAGTLALMISADPDLQPWDAREILAATATDVGLPGVDHQTGHGLVNCYRAVREVLRRKCHREGTDSGPFEGRQLDDALDAETLRQSLARRVQVVRAVLPGSVASERDIRVGDVAESIDGRVIESIKTVRAAVKQAQASHSPCLVCVIRRDGKRIELELATPDKGVIGIALDGRHAEPVFQ